jgi:sugar O-acyltransferase (sialic acid O-acetyltransferase NeuD family)
MKKLLVMGASGHGKVVADAALAASFDVIAFADEDPAKRGLRLLGIEVRAIGLEETIRLCRESEAEPVVAIGSNAARRRVFLALRDSGLEPATIVHPAATVAPSASLGAGTVVFAGVVVNPDTTVGENVILNTGATIDHDNHIGSHAHISPGAHLGGTVTVGEGTHVGIGSTIKNNVAVGAWSVIGAGSAVVRDVPDGVVAYGVPARVTRPNQPPTP